MMMMMMIMMMMLIKSINPFALMFSGGRERVHWEQMGYVLIPATTTIKNNKKIALME